MAIKHQIGETLRLTATITDIDVEEVNPTTVKISINKPNGTPIITLIAMENPATGSYYYDYLISNDTGVYKWKVTAVGTGGRITIVKDSFVVEKSI